MFALAISVVCAPHSAFADEPTQPKPRGDAIRTSTGFDADRNSDHEPAESPKPRSATPNNRPPATNSPSNRPASPIATSAWKKSSAAWPKFRRPSDPRRAKLLREAIAQSREEDVNIRFESIVKLLQDERLSAAATNQTELQKELDNLLSLLLKADRDNELNSQRDRVKQYLKEVGRSNS